MEFDDSCGAVSLFADDDFGNAVDPVHFVLPGLMFGGVGARFLAGQVVFFAVDEQHHVSVLLDGTGFAQVCELRTLVIAIFDLTRQLREGNDRHR